MLCTPFPPGKKNAAVKNSHHLKHPDQISKAVESGAKGNSSVDPVRFTKTGTIFQNFYGVNLYK